MFTIFSDLFASFRIVLFISVLPPPLQGFSLLPTGTTNEDFTAQLVDLSGQNFMRDYHMPDFLLVFPTGTTFHDCPLYKNGTLILQVLALRFLFVALRDVIGEKLGDMRCVASCFTTPRIRPRACPRSSFNRRPVPTSSTPVRRPETKLRSWRR